MDHSDQKQQQHTSTLLSQIRDFLLNKTVSEFPTQSEILEINAESVNPLDAFRQIVSNGYLSAPVFLQVGHKQYIGFLDTRNLVAWVVFAYDEQNTRPSLDEIVNHGIKRVSVAIDSVTVSYLARSNPFNAVSSDEKLLKAFEVLCARDCHRVPVLGEDGNVKKLITQYGVIEYLYKNKDQYQIALAHTVGELNIGSGPVVTASSHTPTIEVFQKMEKNNLSGIAVLNDEGKIVGATSGADLKAFLKYTESSASLDLSIMQFLNMIRQESLRATVPVLVCENSATLGTVISKLAATREHRIFVIDNAKSFKPVKVISLSDILSAIAHTK